MTQLDIREVEALVTQRYLTDPAFHARVQLAVEMTSISMRRATGMSVGSEFWSALVQACAYGCYAADLDVTKNIDDDTHASMRAQAAHLGFELKSQATPE